MGTDREGSGGAGRFDRTQPVLAWLTAVQELGSAAFGQVDELTRLSQSQWRLVRDGMALMADLPLSAVEEGGRELARLREALRAVQLQMALVDEQLKALEQVLQPVQEWSLAWRGLLGEDGGPPAASTDGPGQRCGSADRPRETRPRP